MKTKKLINDPEAVVDEMVEGMLAAHPRHLRRAEGHRRALVAVDGPRPGKVGIVVGGGSGHEPTFAGLVGRGLADAVAIGNVFASPPPDPILAATRAADGGAGVLYLYGNYAGDCMNFDMAAELAALDGIEVRTVVTIDDVASAPPDRKDERRGVAGNAFVFKVAGAAADLMLPLGEVERLDAPRRGPRPTPSASRSRPARCRRRACRTSRSPRARWRSAWASTASPASSVPRSALPTRWRTTSSTASSPNAGPARATASP